MDAANFEAKIQAMRERVRELQERKAEASGNGARISPETVEELSTTLEELRVAEEELHAQNEELVAAREILEAERQRYAELFEFAPDGYLVTDAEGTIREANRAAAQLLGNAGRFLQGKPLVLFVAPEDRQAFHSQLTLVLETDRGEPWQVSLSPRGKCEAATVPVSMKVAVIRNQKEAPVGLRWMLRDITSRLQAQEALRRERDFAESLITTAPDIVLVLDLEGRIVRFNPYLEELSGYRLDEVRGQDWVSTFLPERERPGMPEGLREIADDQGNLNHVSRPLRTKSGAERVIEWSNKVLRDGQGERLGILAIGRDITELKHAQERALQAERLAAIGQMVAGLTHESRNALQRSQACLEMLAMELRDQPKALDLIARTQKAQAHLHQLFEGVREYAASIRLERRRCNLASIWREAWSHLQTMWRSRSIALREEIGGVDLQCRADPFRLGQTFRNLLENALAARADPVQITISCLETKLEGRPAVRILVRDNGPGLTPEQAARIFEPFFTTKTHGTGLGTAIARRIVEAHGGRIEAGNNPGGGAEIRITLPRGE
jgi:PAS domain S-box-containing protein